MREKISCGCLVLAPIRGVFERGIVFHLHAKEPAFDTQPLSEVCSPSLLEPWQYTLAKYVAQKTFVPIARVLPLFLPKKIFDSNGIPPEKRFVKKSDTPPVSQKKKHGKKRKEILEFLTHTPEIEMLALQKATKSTRKMLLSAQEEGFISIRSLPLSGKKFSKKVPFPPLSKEQKSAYTLLKTQKSSLLFAPTGSGKSHLLRMRTRDILLSGKTVLILVPEIGLTQGIFSAYTEVFGKEYVDMYHSRLSEGEKAHVFWRIKRGVTKILIGSRISLFLPFCHLGMIAIEEEHERSFKSDASPRYRTQDVAQTLAKICGSQYILSSATPRLETYMEYKKKGDILSLPQRNTPTTIRIIDLQAEKKEKNPTLLSRYLQRRMQEVIQKKQQVLLFLNRRGFHRTLSCEECAEQVLCPSCNISLVSHSGKERSFLVCHYCGKVFGIPQRCTSCASPKLQYFGSGTAKIENIVHSLFPDANTIRIDRDTTSKKEDFSHLYSQITSGAIDILIGTQIIAKGLDFKNIGLVAVLDADSMLHIPDFRSAEYAYQLLTQVIGRAGRSQKASEAILQTRLPQHPLFGFLQQNNTHDFLEQELLLREQFFLPPFSKIIKLIFVGLKKETVFQQARNTQKLLQSIAKQRFPQERVDVSVAPALQPKKYGKYHVHILLTAKNPEEIIRATPLKGCRIDNNPTDSMG